jgi:hypothetical protein
MLTASAGRVATIDAALLQLLHAYYAALLQLLHADSVGWQVATIDVDGKGARPAQEVLVAFGELFGAAAADAGSRLRYA